MQECPRCGKQANDSVRFCPACGAGLAGSWSGRLRAGDLLCDRYTIVRPLARGGMGAVYVATDGRLGDAPVAVKEMIPRHEPGDTKAWEQALTEFRREAALLARLSHAGLPHVIDQFHYNDSEFLVMELVAGQTLRAELSDREHIPLDQAMQWFHQLSEVLDYLHAQKPQIIYRDLKPSNVMIRPDGRLVLIDFGIARLYKPEQTTDTAIYGTPGYAPPEQYGLGQTDVRTDIYALAMMFHQVFTGYDVTKREHARPPKAATLRSGLPEHVSEALHKALDPDPDRRFNTIGEFRAAMDQTPVVEAQATLIRAHQEADGTLAQLSTAAPAVSEHSVSSSATPPRQTWLWWSLAAAGMLGIVAAVWFFMRDPGIAGVVATVEPSTEAQIQATTPAEQLTPLPNSSITPLATAVADSVDVANVLPPPPGMQPIAEGEFTIGGSDQPDEEPETIGFLPIFFIDKREVSNAQYRECVDATVCSPPQATLTSAQGEYWDNPQFADYPVVWVSWNQARTYCGWLGERLPTEAEWEKAARGTDGLRWPWGNDWDPALLAVAAEGLQAVDSLSEAQSPYGLLHMAGNAAEWTSSLDVPYPYNANDGRELTNRDGSRIIRGAVDVNDPQATSYLAARNRALPNDAFETVGFRCATEKPYESDDLDYVPAGRWLMGATDEQLAQLQAEYGWRNLLGYQPATELETAAFFIDRYEVTNTDYAEFVAETGYKIPRNPFDPEGLSVWNSEGVFLPEFAAHPVVNVDWNDAQAYCAWADKRLPTEAEWERAAKGSDNRTWPWGEEWNPDFANTVDSDIGTTQSTGSYDKPGPYGTYDLTGNVWEWTSSLFKPYPYDAEDGRESPAAAGTRVLRGGSWFDSFQAAHTMARNSLQPDLANVNVGFRCVLEP